MAVRVRYQLLLPGFESVEQLKDYVKARDELEAGPEDAIALENVTGHDVLALFFNAELPNVAFDSGGYPTGYPMEIIEVNEMEEA